MSAAAAAVILALSLLAVSVGPRVLPYQALVVRSGSMSPTIPTGSVVFYRSEPASAVKPGQIIVFDDPLSPGVLVTHRVVSVSGAGTGRLLTTKGDANGSVDDWTVHAQGSGWVAVFHVPLLGYALYALQSRTAHLLLILLPLSILGLWVARDHYRGRKRLRPVDA